MSRITIIPGNDMSTNGTEVYVDGLKLEGVTGITLVAKLHDVWRCTIDMAISPEDIDLGADVTVVCHAEPPADVAAVNERVWVDGGGYQQILPEESR